jgi:glc operon protein GlcG
MKNVHGSIAVLFSVLTWPFAAKAQMPNAYGPSIGVETARKVAAVALVEARKNSWNVAVAVVDIDGELVYFERMDNAQVGGVKVSQEKARTAARFKRPTKVFEDALVGGRQAILGLPEVIPLEGGIPLLVDNKIVGAVGVSGATSQQDGVCAKAAADTLDKRAAAWSPPPAAAKKPSK